MTDMANLSAASDTVPAAAFSNENEHSDRSVYNQKKGGTSLFSLTLSVSLLAVFNGGIC